MLQGADKSMQLTHSCHYYRDVARVQARATEVTQRKEALVQAMQQQLDATNDAVYKLAEQAGMAL